MILRELEVGDKFVHAKSKAKRPKVFTVISNAEFNIARGTATRPCYETASGALVNKICILEVRKIGESKHKQKMIDRLKNKRNEK
jgi:hypothetical protein